MTKQANETYQLRASSSVAAQGSGRGGLSDMSVEEMRDRGAPQARRQRSKYANMLTYLIALAFVVLLLGMSACTAASTNVATTDAVTQPTPQGEDGEQSGGFVMEDSATVDVQISDEG